MPAITPIPKRHEARRGWRIRGQVQGVGFRPFVFREAAALGLTGLVRNDGDGVVIEAQGPADALDRFEVRLRWNGPALARIDTIDATPLKPVRRPRAFRIVGSRDAATPPARIAIDSATCDDCVTEMLDPRDRRAGHALINCTNCGPRYSIIRRVPYDRPHTTMSGFTMCAACQAEYDDPNDRRFHAQPIACPGCGPKLSLATPTGHTLPGDPIRVAAERLRAGALLLIKGLGGYHLACRADHGRAVSRLRDVKHRDAKPFALMVRSIEAARRLVVLSAAAEAEMRSPRCPIVLAPRRRGLSLAEGVAPGNHRLGVMLPYTPVHHLLFAELGDLPLVMTSANLSDEPLVFDDDEALRRVGGLCDAILRHDRPIQRPIDDSVLIDVGGGSALLPVRRARGYVPEPITLPVACDEPGLCVGGELKNTVAVVRDGRAILSHHLGDLKHPLAFTNFRQTIDDLCRLFDITPRWIAHDLHPAYLSTHHAQHLAQRRGLRLLGVQHHHAHAAALMAEHHLTEPILALACDGVGYGVDGTSWGGELLLASLHDFRRVARLRPLRLPGGDASAHDPRRGALALLDQALGAAAFAHPAAVRLLPDIPERRALAAMFRHGTRCISSSGLGRVFDGLAALLGLSQTNGFEGESAMALESAAARYGDRVVEPIPGPPGYRLQPAAAEGEPMDIDLSPLTAAIADHFRPGDDPTRYAAWCHEQIAQALGEAAMFAAEAQHVDTIGLTGGCFLNTLLTRKVKQHLERAGFTVLTHRRVPPGDGGLSLGQAAVAGARLASATKPQGGRPCA